MRLIIALLICLFLVPASAMSQERVLNVTVGPSGDQTRIVVAIIEPSQEAYRMQSMIIDVKLLKNSKEPSSFQVDLTSTIRSLSTGSKKQMIVLLRSKQSGEIELKCDGKWVKHEAANAVETIIEATLAVIRSVPTEKRAPTEVNLPTEIEEKVSSVLSSLDTINPPCLRRLN